MKNIDHPHCMGDFGPTCQVEWRDGWGDHICCRRPHDDSRHRCDCDAVSDIPIIGASIHAQSHNENDRDDPAMPEASPEPIDDTAMGLYDKYIVKRRNDPSGKHTRCEYFVLDPQHDPAARAALRTYARVIRPSHPQLADDVIQLTMKYEPKDEDPS